MDFNGVNVRYVRSYGWKNSFFEAISRQDYCFVLSWLPMGHFMSLGVANLDRNEVRPHGAFSASLFSVGSNK